VWRQAMTEITRHFTATTYPVYAGSVLLHLHAKQQLWLPPGGHLERDELPHEAARREIEEETGLNLVLHSEQQAAELTAEMECLVVPQPAFILVEDINLFHQHIDFTYFARVPDSCAQDERARSRWEEAGFRWFAAHELTMAGVPRNVEDGARRAVAYFAAHPT